VYHFLRGDESDYSEDAPYGETRSDGNNSSTSSGKVEKQQLLQEKHENKVTIMTKYVPDPSKEMFGTANDQVSNYNTKNSVE
jgi:hypothetical protein